jgi:hypothetical protein
MSEAPVDTHSRARAEKQDGKPASTASTNEAAGSQA